MNIQFRKIDKTNYNECIKLKIAESQKRFVAPNTQSLIQAAYEPNLYPLAIYCNNEMVGFILYDFDEELDGWSMSRFMIGENFQNKGIGKLALSEFLEFFGKEHKSEEIYTSVSIENPVAIQLYEQFGFEKIESFQYELDGVLYKEFKMIKRVLFIA